MASSAFSKTASSSDANSSVSMKLKSMPVSVFPVNDRKSELSRQITGEKKPKPPVSTKPISLAQLLTSNLETRPAIDRHQSWSPNLNSAPSTTKEFLSTSGVKNVQDISTTQQHTQKRTQISLPDIWSEYSSALPLTVQVTKIGESRLPLSTGTVLHVLATKSTTVVSAISGPHSFVVPLNSSVPFSVLYDPDSNTKKALDGHVFHGVRALVKAKVLPKVVCVTEAKLGSRSMDARMKGASVSNSIEKGEILVLDPTEIERQGYKAFSLKTKTEKSLSEDCKFSFSTCPQLVSMHVTDIVQWIADQFPCKVTMADIKAPNINPFDITLLELATEQSLICLRESSGSQLLDIPVSAPEIKVTIEDKICYKDVNTLGAELISKYKLDTVVYVRDPTVQETQTFFYSHVRPGYENTGVKLIIPQSITDLMKAPPKAQTTVSSASHISATRECSSSAATRARADTPDSVHLSQTKATIDITTGSNDFCVKWNSNSQDDGSENKNGRLETKLKATGLKETKPVTATPISFGSLKQTSLVAKCFQNLKSEPIPIRSLSPYNAAVSSVTQDFKDRQIEVNTLSTKKPASLFEGRENDGQQTQTREPSESPPFYAALTSVSVNDDASVKMPEAPQSQIDTSALIREGKKSFKPPPPKPYEKRASVSVPAVTTISSTLQHTVATKFDAENIQDTEEEDQSEELEGYSYVFMKPKDSTTKQIPCSAVTEIRNDNRQYLSSLNMDEVQSVLAKNGLEQYADVFRKERIDGGILSMLGDDDLRLELKIESRLHRLRLMRIISGDVNIKPL